MPKIYYRCSKCHTKARKGMDISSRFGRTLFGGQCKKCNLYVPIYYCQDDYWWERLYLSIREIIRSLK